MRNPAVDPAVRDEDADAAEQPIERRRPEPSGDVDTSIVLGCEHYDMSVPDEDENWDHADDEPQDVDTSIVFEDRSSERRLAALGRGRGRSSKGKGRLGGRKGSAKPYVSLQKDLPIVSWFPTEVEAAFAASVRLKKGMPLLIDFGSPGNLCGDGWSDGMAKASISKINRAPEYKQRDRTLTCRGVGTGAQSSDWDVRHTIALGNGRLDTFTAPELPDSDVPGI